MSEVTQVLLNTQNPDNAIRSSAEQQIKIFESSNLPGYLGAICTELANEEKPAESRQAAGILLKNILVGPSENASVALRKRWLSQIPEEVKVPIRTTLLNTLGSPIKPIRGVVAQVISVIASVEIPLGQWDNLIPTLVNLVNTTTNTNLKAASLEAIGFICELIPSNLQDKSGDILHAIFNGLSTDSTVDIKLAATVALSNSLEFISANMAKEDQRTVIMRMIFGATLFPNVQVQKAAFSCLVTIAGTYYQFLEAFMKDLFELTSKAMNGDEEEVALMATEFWTTIAEEEAAIEEEQAEAAAVPGKTSRTSSYYIRKAFATIAPIILKNLTKQTEDGDNDEWNVAQSAGSCLTFCALAAGDEVVKVVLPFITSNIQNPDWRFREASTLAFGCILDGPSPKVIKPLVTDAFILLLNHLKDTKADVVDTAAWTIGKICAVVPDTISDSMLPQLMAAFAYGLTLSPKIASHICWAIHNLASNVEGNDKTSPLSQYMKGLLEALLNCADRTTTKNLLMPTYEAINILIATAAPDTYPLIAQLLPNILQRLGNTLQQGSLSGEAKERQTEIQGLLCGSLQVIIQKQPDAVILPHADSIMASFLRVLEASKQSLTVLEEAIMAIGALANRVGKQFENYITFLKPYLLLGLDNHQESKVCEICVGLVGDVARALEIKFAVIADEVMAILLKHLQSDSIDRMLKPAIISCIGDIALALGRSFDRYLNLVMRMIIQASEIPFSFLNADDDAVEYIITLRISLLETYTAILFAFQVDGVPEILTKTTPNSVESMLLFIDLLAKEYGEASASDKDFVPHDDLVKAVVSLIGDLGQTYQGPIGPSLKRPSIRDFVNIASRSDDPDVKAASERAMEIVAPLISN